MKSTSVFICKVVLIFALSIVAFMPSGCSSFSQPGETAAEGNRRHQRIARINQQQAIADVDKTLMLDKPSKLTDKRIP